MPRMKVCCNFFLVWNVWREKKHVANHYPSPKKNGELFAVGYYGSRLFTSCYGIRGESSDPVLVIHHGNFVNCQNYVSLQQLLWNDHQQASCCVERAGFGYSPTPDLATKVDLVAETKV